MHDCPPAAVYKLHELASHRINKKLATNCQLSSACEFQQCEFFEFNFLERKL